MCGALLANSFLAHRKPTVMTPYERLLHHLGAEPRTWLITGVAGFIGSNLLQTLLQCNQRVVGLDNFSTGKEQNIAEALDAVTLQQGKNFHFEEGDIRNLETCQRACSGVNYVLHQAALGSVPRSIENPIDCNENNVSGFLNMLVATRDQRVQRFVYASSSALYGDAAEMPKVEGKIGRPLSPYAVTKLVNELYAEVFLRNYGVKSIGLRYFNVFGPRQDPNGAYAAVIPQWIAAMMKKEPVILNGDGSTSRDFCFVSNAVQANLLAATTCETDAIGSVFNVALSERTTLLELFELIRQRLILRFPHLKNFRPEHRPFRAGDVLHSQADIGQARKVLGYAPSHTVAQGLDEALDWYRHNLLGKILQSA